MEFNKEVAAKLWSAITVSVERFNTAIRFHDKSTFLGYADIKVDASATIPGLVFQLRGVECKILKGNAHIDMPSEKGKDGVFYPRYFPQSAELRAVLTTAIFRADAVKSAIVAATEQAARAGGAPAQAASAPSNPFTS